MEDLEITDHAVYERQPQDILDARREIRVARAELAKIEQERARPRARR